MSTGPETNCDAFTCAEVARRIAVSTRTVMRAVQRGDLPCVRLGRSLRIPAVALAAFLMCGQQLSDCDDLRSELDRVRDKLREVARRKGRQVSPEIDRVVPHD